MIRTIQTVLDADLDGSVHLPLPAELRQSKVKVVAPLTKVVEAVPTNRRKIAHRGGLENMARNGTLF